MATSTEFIAQFKRPMTINRRIHGKTICNPNCPHYVHSSFYNKSTPMCSLYNEELKFATMGTSNSLGLFSIPVDKCLEENFT